MLKLLFPSMDEFLFVLGVAFGKFWMPMTFVLVGAILSVPGPIMLVLSISLAVATLVFALYFAFHVLNFAAKLRMDGALAHFEAMDKDQRRVFLKQNL